MRVLLGEQQSRSVDEGIGEWCGGQERREQAEENCAFNSQFVGAKRHTDISP